MAELLVVRPEVTAGSHVRNPLPARVLTTVIALAAVAFQLYSIQVALGAARSLEEPSMRVVALSWMVLVATGGLGAAVLCLALLWRSSPRPESSAFALVIACLAYFFGAEGLSRFYSRFPSGSVTYTVLDWSIPASVLLGCAALLRFSVLFPEPLTASDVGLGGRWRGWRLLLLRPSTPWLFTGGIFLANAAAFGAVSAWNQRYGTGLRAGSVAVPATIGLVLWILALVVANLRAGFRRADLEGKRRLFWVVEGVFVATTLLIVAAVVKAVLMLTSGSDAHAWWYPMASFAALTAMVVCFAIAMFFAGAIDPALAIRRTAVVGLLSVLMLFLFAGVEQVIQEYLGAWVGFSERVGGVLTGGTVALLIDPVRDRVTQLVRRAEARWGATPPETEAGRSPAPALTSAGR